MLFSTMCRSPRKKINKEVGFNDTSDQATLTDTCWEFHPMAAEYTFFSDAHKTFSGTDHTIGRKTCLSQLKKTEIIPSVYSNHKSIKVGISNRRKARKFTNMWRLNNILMKNQWVKVEVKRDIKNIWKEMTIKAQHIKIYGV